MGVLVDEDEDVRRNAAIALGKIGDLRAIPALIRCLEDSRPGVRFLSAAVLVGMGAPSVAPLVEVLESGSIAARCLAASSLGEIGDERALGPLLFMLDHSDWALRAFAADALGELGDLRATPSLTSHLRAESDAFAAEKMENALRRLRREVR